MSKFWCGLCFFRICSWGDGRVDDSCIVIGLVLLGFLRCSGEVGRRFYICLELENVSEVKVGVVCELILWKNE